MRTVRGKTAFGLQGAPQTADQAVHRIGHWADFCRKRRSPDGREVAPAARFDFALQGQDRSQGPAHQGPDAEQAERQQSREWPNQHPHRLDNRLSAMARKFGRSDEQRALNGAFGVEAKMRAGVESWPQVARESRGIGVVGLQQHSAFGIAHDISDIFLMRTDRSDPLRRHIVGGSRVAVEHLDIGERQDTLRNFLQSTVEHLVDFAAENESGAHGPRQPQSGHPDRETEAESALQAALRRKDRPPHASSLG